MTTTTTPIYRIGRSRAMFQLQRIHALGGVVESFNTNSWAKVEEKRELMRRRPARFGTTRVVDVFGHEVI